MEERTILNKGKQFLYKYRYVLLVVLIGLALMWIPGNHEEGSNIESPVPTVASLADKMEQILANIEDAGEVKVLLTLEKGEETVFQTDEDRDGDSLRLETVLITDSSRKQEGLVRQTNPPKYQGAVILCQGADSTSVRLAIIDAVAKLTGLGYDRICVLKMK